MIENTSHKISIRDWQLSDLPIIKHWYQGHHAWMDLDAPYFKKPDADLLDKRIEYYRTLCEIENLSHPRQNLVIALNDELIGNISWYYTSKETNWISLGIAIFDPIFWQKGYGTEALFTWTNYLFENMPHIVRLDLTTWSGNMGMQKTALKLGFKEEARFRNARIVNGQYYDSLSFGVLREEWEAQLPMMKMKFHSHMSL